MRSCKNQRGHWVLVLILGMLTACARYHARPLSPSAVRRTLREPTHEALVRAAKRLRMAPLAPIRLDFARPLTPRAVGVIAVLANPDLIALRARARVATAQVFAAGLLPNPVVSASSLIPYGTRSSGHTTAYNAGFLWDLSQLFTRPVTLRIARETARAARFHVAWQEWVVANQARLLAIRLYWLQKSRAQAISAGTLAQAYAIKIARAAKAKAIPATQASRAQAIALVAEEAAAAYDRRVRRTRLALNAVLGLRPGDHLSLAQPAPPPPVLPSPRKLFIEAQHDRLDLVALRAAYKSAQGRLERAILGQYPQIGIGLDAARDNSAIPSAGWQLTLTLPFNGNRGPIAVARARRAVLYHTYMARLAQDRAMIYRLYTLLQNYTREIKVLAPQEHTFDHLTRSALAAGYNGALNAQQMLAIVLRDAIMEEQFNTLRIAQAQSYVGLVVASGARWQERRL